VIFFDPFDSDPLETQGWTDIDRHLRLPNNARLMRIAKAIDNNHKGQADGTAGWRTTKNRYVGLYGERAFARIFELPMDLALKRFGNQRRNFELRSGVTVDVVTRSWEAGLSGGPMPELTLRHKQRPTGKVLVLVYYQGEHLEPLIKGWITEKEAHEIGRVDQFKEGIENVVVAPYDLHDMVELLRAHDPTSPWITAHEQHQARKQRQETMQPEPAEPAQVSLF
jgi:hypothetical protein